MWRWLLCNAQNPSYFSYIVDITRIHVLCLQPLQASSFSWTLRLFNVWCAFRFCYIMKWALVSLLPMLDYIYVILIYVACLFFSQWNNVVQIGLNRRNDSCDDATFTVEHKQHEQLWLVIVRTIIQRLHAFPYQRIHFLNTRYAFSRHCSPQKVLRNLAAADELPDNFFSSFEFARRTQERRTVFGPP